MAEHFADGANNNCTSSTDYDATLKTFFNIVEPQAAAQHLDIIYDVEIPPGFQSWNDPGLVIDFITSGTVTVGVIQIDDSAKVALTSGFPAPASSGTLATISVPKSALDPAGTWTPGTIINVHVRIEGDIASIGRCGQIKKNMDVIPKS